MMVEVTQTDYVIAAEVCSAANITTNDGYYEVDIDAASKVIGKATADLQAKLDMAVESLKTERENTIKECASIAIKLGQCGNVRGYADCCERTAEDIEQSILALITDKSERDE